MAKAKRNLAIGLKSIELPASVLRSQEYMHRM
jgi:hypothetical protein